MATDVGDIVSTGGFEALGTDTIGTLYSIATNGSDVVLTLDKSNANTLTSNILGVNP